MTEAQRKYHERQRELDEAKLIAEATSVEAAAKCSKEYAKDQDGLAWMMEHNPKKIQHYFPFLLDAPKDIAHEAMKYIGWSRYHESITVINHYDGAFHYRKVREKFELARDNESGELVRDEAGQFVKVGRARGKWIAGSGEKTGYPFPRALFETVDDFGDIVVCEGEKDAINLNLYGVPAITLGGVGERWEPHAELLRNRHVILWHDNDEAGMKANERASEVLREVCASVMIVDWRRLDPMADNKADVSDYLIKIGRIGADALLRRLRMCRFTLSVTKSFDEVSMAMFSVLKPLHYERDAEIAEMMKIFIQALKNDKESNAYGKIMDRANMLINKYPEKAEAVRLARLPAPSEEEKEKLEAYEKARIKGVKILEEACEDAVLYEYFSKTFMGEMRKHVTSDVVLHWSNSFKDVGVDFVRNGISYLYWCGTHYKQATDTQIKNTFNRFLEMSRINLKQRLNYSTFKRPALESILDNAYFIDNVHSRWDKYAVINHQGGTILIDELGNVQHKAHDRDDYMTYVLPFKFDPNAKMPKWTKFLNTVIPDESVQMVLQEYVGYLFLPKYLQKFLFLYGMGANGKSVFIKVVASLFDDANVSYLKVQDMYDHNLDNLNGKKLNISSELSGNATAKGQIETVKEIAEGATITVNPKHEKAYKIYNPPKMIMSANTKLTGGGQNDGLIRRLMMIPFEAQIPERERNEDLHTEIINEEMSGVLNWAIEGLLRLIKNRGKFTQSNILDEVTEQYREETDQVYSYIKENFGQYEGAVPDSGVRRVNDLPLIYNEKFVISTKYLYAHYQIWAKDNGVHEMKQQNFTSKLCEKLKTKSTGKRVKMVHVAKGYSGGDSMIQSYESKVVKCIVGFSVTNEIKINVNGLNLSVMETIMQGVE